MSILIKGMEMPPSCYYCSMTNDGFYLCQANNPYRQLEDDCEERRPDWCPLILAADVRPVVRGKWFNDFCGKGRFSKRIVQCSLCGNFLDLDGVNAGRGDVNYCPNCGARMDAKS